MRLAPSENLSILPPPNQLEDREKLIFRGDYYVLPVLNINTTLVLLAKQLKSKNLDFPKSLIVVSMLLLLAPHWMSTYIFYIGEFLDAAEITTVPVTLK